MSRNILLCAVMAAMILGCQRPELIDSMPSEDVFTASVETFDGLTKTSMTADRCVVWSADDCIALFKGSTVPDKYVLVDEFIGQPEAEFHRLYDDQNQDYVFSAGTEISQNIAFYPHQSNLSLNTTTLEKEGSAIKVSGINLPCKQDYTQNSFANGAFPMVAVTKNVTGQDLKFKNVLGAIKLQIKGNQIIKSITIEGRGNELLSGNAEVTAYSDNKVPAITMIDVDDASKSVVLDCGDGVQLKEHSSTDFIIALPPVTFTKGFIVTIYDSEGNSYTIVAKAANTVLRSSILVMPEFVLGSSFESNCTDCGKFPCECFAGPIIIDGDFSDWNGFGLAVATCASEANKTALITLKTYSTIDVLYVYLKFDKDQIWDSSRVPLDIYLDADGNATTGYKYYYDARTEWLLEGYIMSDGDFCSYDPSLYQWTGDIEDEWNWTYCHSYVADGMGARNEYEIAIYKDLCPEVEFAETFGIGVVILQDDWSVVGILPNTDVTDENATGKADLLRVTSSKTSNDLSLLNIKERSVNIYEGDATQLTAIATTNGDLKFDITWSTSDATIAIVDKNGLVTGVSEGNAVIYACASGVIDGCTVSVLHSPTPTIDYIDEYGINHGKGTAVGPAVWAPVNCGYHATDYKWGKLYQFGRKYGQGYSGYLYDAEYNVLGHTSDATVPDIAEGGVTLKYGQSEANKNVFFKQTDYAYDSWVYPHYPNLWYSGSEQNLIKTEYDPCPSGWRVPTRSEISALKQRNYTIQTNHLGQTGFWVRSSTLDSEDSPRVFFPAAGFRFAGSEAYGRGYNCIYWYSYGAMGFNSYDIRSYTEGYALRCVQE